MRREIVQMKDRIKIIIQAFCDENDYNAQNLNAKEMAYRLDPSRFDVTLFYLNRPDRRLLSPKNIRLVKMPNTNEKPMHFITFLSLLRRLLDKGAVLFSPRGLPGYLHFIFKKLLHDKKITIFTIECILPPFNLGWFSEFIQRSNVHNCDYVYSNSNYVAETVKEYYGIETPVIYTGVDTRIFTPLPKKEKDEPKVLYVGSFQQRKRPYLVLEAAKRFPKVDFELIGSGPLQEMLVNMRKKSKLGNVQIRGHLPLENLVSSMQEADVFLFPSVQEGFPKVTIEAAAMALPVIVFNNYKPETVIDNETGFIVGNVEEMMEKLEILVENGALRREMGVKAREHAKEFDWDVIVKQWEKEFEMAVKKNEF